jgi:hypothetical protein
MSEIDDLVRIQDERWLGPHPQEPKWARDAKNMEAWPPHVPRREFDPERNLSLYELMMRRDLK